MNAQVTALKDKLESWFQGLSESEQKLVKFGSIFLAVFILFTVISSVNSGVTESKRKLQQQQSLNTWAAEQISIIKSSTGGNQANFSGSMTQVVNATARQFNIRIARLQPKKNDMVKVGLDDVGFNRLMKWLAELQSKHGVRVENIDFAKGDEQGKVKVRRLDLSRG